MLRFILAVSLFMVSGVTRAELWETTCARSVGAPGLPIGTTYRFSFDDEYQLAIVNNGFHLLNLNVRRAALISPGELSVFGSTSTGSEYLILFSRNGASEAIDFDLPDGSHVTDICHH